MQRYIISSKTTKRIISCGRVNIERDKKWIKELDNSTTYGSILKRLEQNSDLQVLYLPNGDLPKVEVYKINENNTAVILKTDNDKEAEEKAKAILNKEAEISKLNEVINAETKKAELETELAALKN